MEVNVNKLRQSVFCLRAHVEKSLPTFDNCVLKKFEQLSVWNEADIQDLLKLLIDIFLNPKCTELIAVNFEEFLLLILSETISCDFENEYKISNFAAYQSKCIALAKLQRLSVEARRYATNYFRAKPAPFEENTECLGLPPNKKAKHSSLDYLSLLKCCYQLLITDPAYYKELWNWSILVESFLNNRNELTMLEQLYFNHILAILCNMSSKKLSQLNAEIPPDVLLRFDDEQNQDPEIFDFQLDIENAQIIKFHFKSDCITNIENVLLLIFNKSNYNFYAQTDGAYEQIVKVDSTKVNLRSIALGIATSKTICLSGPVGCGKTTLVQYLARKTGRICPKPNEIKFQQRLCKENNKEQNGVSNKLDSTTDLSEENLTKLLNLETQNTNGFLRIQLGDQTDTKMLLGQYRCTDVPGEFIWLPGILTQAVMNGYWLLLEDLDSATQDTYTILSGLLENNYLSVPGFRDCVKIQPGFQLFVTVRTNKSSTNSTQKALFSLLEKYLYTINILPLSRNELCKVVSTTYPKLATVANRIVDVFLTFSRGDHNVADNLRSQEIGDKADNTENYVALPFEKIDLATIPNAGRLVSTRDLIKLCQRSNAMFSVTSTECAYFIFQNAVDVFCSNLPQGKEKTKLIVSIGAKLGIIQSRCETYANDYKPEVKVDAEFIKVGRAELYAKGNETEMKQQADFEEEFLVSKKAKRQKLSLNTEKEIAKPKIAHTRATYSFTRLASCLLERIAVCVSHAEPILLVGETGVGKTTSVQYLAERTAHKLIVVNMNNQSDISDLIGGFKPVDLNYVLAPLRQEFEALFCETYDATKNAIFLNKLSTCYNQNVFTALIKMMIKVANAALTAKTKTIDIPIEILKLQPRWQLLKTKLLKLNTQLVKSINISFAFIPGALVNCIKNGDWVLLDEINLASAETLECLSTILEPDGSVVLLEKGDFMPVRRHSDFRIFACMNPNTDIGKKDLPIGIRNRFTEFFVDELTTDSDLSLLVTDYLNSTDIQHKSVTTIVKLYKKLRKLANFELNDGLGNRPVYTLRTLCRALRICAKNLCGSIERNLYESFCMSFLTQLDVESHKLVLNLIKAALLKNEKAILRQAIPKPAAEGYLNFEGFWIQQGPKELQTCENYILTESVKAHLKDLSRIISIGKLPILLQGPTSAGKTSLIEYVAKRSGNHCLRINNHEHTELQEYIGTYVADLNGKLKFHEGVLVQAMRNGYWIILDELNLATTEILEALNRVLDDNRELYITETQTLIKAHANFMLFATQNPPGLYGGRKTLSRAFKNRFIELHFTELPRLELEIILERRCLIPASYAKKMVMCMSELQKNHKTTTKHIFTLRDLFRWGQRYTYANKKLLETPSYDWNQHLVEEGYLVLSSKVRTQLEIELIVAALYRNFKKHIDLKRLFDVKAEKSAISPVTLDILEAIKDFKTRSDIVWTSNMTRMAVLTAKALEFDEPVLLVGPTGCGKTTVCQLLASIKHVKLRILNCHMHTEAADFLGGLRPCRQNNNEQRKLFEWTDGALIQAMLEGSYFMADEISLAEDAVLERLNCILEPERTVLLAEKGGISIDENNAQKNNIANDFLIKAKNGFQFLATMNPAGDFGKKELSPALRNRFTEIWCLPTHAKAELIQIASNCMCTALKQHDMMNNDKQAVENIATYLVDVVLFIKTNVEKFQFSVRDILAWANYMIQNSHLSFAERAIFGLETIFLDALEMLPHESIAQIEKLRNNIILYAIAQANKFLQEKFTIADVASKRGKEVVADNEYFGLKPFLLQINANYANNKITNEFTFKAPTTKKNLFRLLSALSLKKPILLEGPPGVGKTSIVENLAKAIGFKIVRINLCEHTDLADLFGTDLPAEHNVLNTANSTNTAELGGTFIWRDGALLAALKAENTWILLDELNLAPQSVLEGLNAILDHRGEVYIPELNKCFNLNKSTRIFACQNPLKQGGGRKGLPQSFLNRFNKVYLRKLTTEDLFYVVNEKYGNEFEQLKLRLIQPIINNKFVENNLFELFAKMQNSSEMEKLMYTNSPHHNTSNCNFVFDLTTRLVKFSEALDYGAAQLEFGYKGGPYEFNLRDILRWCDFLFDAKTGVNFKTVLKTTPILNFMQNFMKFLQTLYDTMRLVYIQRMRSIQDQQYIQTVFARIFICDVLKLEKISQDVSLYWTNENFYINDLVLKRDSEQTQQLRACSNQHSSPLLLSSQREHLKNILACVQHQKPILLCGATDTGKTKLIDAFCTISNQICNTDNIDDSVTGSFQQIDLNRHLEELSEIIECIFWSYIQNILLEFKETSLVSSLLDIWYEYTMLGKSYKLEPNKTSSVSKELLLFRKRVLHLNQLTQQLIRQTTASKMLADNMENLKRIQTSLDILEKHASNVETLNMGGSFEWVDSKIVKSLKYGQYIALEHVNLCSSAVLDRLNPIFEPNGNLLISEKGVSATAAAEIVEKSPNFHAFLTIDPKNGELSRAMRNRCVELALHKDAYTIDDMRHIIHENGLRDIIAINCILSMYNSIKELTELNNYNVSHLNQCAFLVASYKRIGYATARAIYVSGMEVYVYSANMDLLGYGLTYYQNKLRHIVLEHQKLYIENVEKNNNKKHEDFLANLILHCNELNEIKMIKLQLTPLELSLKTNGTDNNVITELARYCNEFENLTNFSIMFYVYMLYEICTFSDLEIRHLQLQRIFKIQPSNDELQQLSNQLYKCLCEFKKKFPNNLNNLPWNYKLYSRIRDYATTDCNDENLYRLSSILISRLLLKQIPLEPSSPLRLQNISVINYSRALNQNLITVHGNNVFLKQLVKLINYTKQLIEPLLNEASICVSEYVALITKLLWFNRLLDLTQIELFKQNQIDLSLLDKIMLHYEWLCKHLLSNLAQITNKTSYEHFDDIFKTINEYIAINKPKLNRLRKFYVKHMMSFQPFYKEEQIRLQNLSQELDNLLSVVPSYGSFTPENVQRKFKAQNQVAASKARAIKNQSNYHGIIMPDIKSIDQVPEHLRKSLQKYINEVDIRNFDNTLENKQLESLATEIETIKNSINPKEELIETETPKEIELGLLAIREYYLTKVLVQKVNNIWDEDEENLNEIYCENIQNLNTETEQLLHVTGIAKGYENLLLVIKQLMAYIDDLKANDVEKFKVLINDLCGSYKDFNAIWRLLLYKCYKQQLTNFARHFKRTQQLEAEIKAEIIYEGPALVNVCCSLLFKADGSLKPIPLKDLNTWQNALKQMQQLLWQNASISTPNYNQLINNFKLANKHAKKLHLEVSTNILEMEIVDESYLNLLNELQKQLELTNELKTKQFQHKSLEYQTIEYQTALLNALIGALELATLVALPLIDPVEKQRLKRNYLFEDIKCLNDFKITYDAMRILLKYKNFGNENYEELAKQLYELELKKMKQTQHVALRPATCLYKRLVQAIEDFLKTNCEPKALLALLNLAQNVWLELTVEFKFENAAKILLNSREVCAKLTLWLANSQNFIYHVLKPYNAYYEDFLAALKCAIQQFTFGLESLKCMLTQLEHAINIDEALNYNENAYIQRLVGNFAEFPNTRVLKVVNSTKTQKLTTLNNSQERLTMLQLRMVALNKHVHIAKKFNNELFEFFDLTLAEYNEIWQLEETHLKQLKAANDSLYVQKTKCETKDENLLELAEIETYFPTQIHEDFGDYLQSDTLEQHENEKKNLIKSQNKTMNLLNEFHINNLVENFMELLELYAHVSYYKPNLNNEQTAEKLDFLNMAKIRLQTFAILYERHKLTLNTWIDEQAYNSLCLAIEMQKTLLNETAQVAIIKSPKRQQQQQYYNFYKDANISEILVCMDLLERIRVLAQTQLELYPAHATLVDIIQIIARIIQLPINAPLVRFSTGFQLLRQKLAQWNEVAHKNNNLHNEENELAAYIQKWMRLELQCWRNCLNQIETEIETRAYRYWFFIYQLITAYLKGNETFDSSLTDMKYAEKRFENSEVLVAEDLKMQNLIKISDIIQILQQFIEVSNYGDFHVRMRLLQTFELYLQIKFKQVMPINYAIKIETLIAGLHNLQIYFKQFSNEISETKQTMRTPIEKKLKEFIKIESYNKDLSYFSMRNNIAKVHRNLNKFLKEYRLQLSQQITPVFQPQDATVKDYNFENNKGKALRYDSKIKYNLQIDNKYFLAAISNQTSDKFNATTCANKINKYFLRARQLVKTILQNTNYTQMIIALDELLITQLEYCEHLRKLNVDRTKERPKQILEAKQILQQKRKALTDLFKELTQLGIKYKYGLREQNLNANIIDYMLPPFCVRNMNFELLEKKEKYSTQYVNMLHLNENLEIYYAKSVFKLKLLQNIMLKPLTELGPSNIERIKGFAMALFLHVQNQRKLLAQTTCQSYELQLNLRKLKSAATLINATAPNLNQTKFKATLENHQQILCHARFVLEQFEILLNCIPNEVVKSQQVLNSNTGMDISITKHTTVFKKLTEILGKTLQNCKKQLETMSQYDYEKYLSYDIINEYKEFQDNELLIDINNMKELCKVPNKHEYLPMAKPLIELLNYIEHMKAKMAVTSLTEKVVDFEALKTQLAEIVDDIRLALQTLHTKYSIETKTENKVMKTQQTTANEENEENKENELKNKHLEVLHDALRNDWLNLRVSKINQQLKEALENIGLTSHSTEKLLYIQKLAKILPLLEQYYLMTEYQLLQQLGAHKVTAKMLSIMLTVFIEISTKGFCVPTDLMQDEQAERKQEQKQGEGFGLEDGNGEKDVSDKIETEDQLDDAKRPEDRKDEHEKDEDKQDNCKEEKGIEMSEDFDGKMQDIEKPENEENDSGESEDDDEDLNKEMGDTEEGAEKLDEQIWGDDEAIEKPEPEDEQMQEEDEGKGTKDEQDTHNDLNTKNDAAKNNDDDDKTNEHDRNALDATNEANEQDKRKEQQKQHIDNMKDAEVDEEQINPYHNELEEPPEPEEMDLSEMNNNNNEAENGDDDENEANNNNENPFDIDSMKQNMPEMKETQDEADNEHENEENEDKEADGNNVDDDDSDNSDDEVDFKQVKNQQAENEQENDSDKETENDEAKTQKRAETLEDKLAEDEQPEIDQTQEEQVEEKPEEHAPSQDKSSKEQNVQSMPNTNDKASADQAPQEEEEEDKNIKQQEKLDEQDTGEEKDGVGQAENEENDGGHQGIAETKETISKEERKNEQKTKEKRKQGRTNEERSLGEAEKTKLKQLKTIDKLKEDKENKNQIPEQPDDEMEQEEAEEYQHVKEPKNSDKITLDNATEEQSKKIQHQEDEEKKDEDDEATDAIETNDDLMDVDDETENINEDTEDLEEITAERNEKKSDKKSKSEKTTEPAENQEQVEIEGEIVQTMTATRGDDTTAHTNKDMLLDTATTAEDLSATELLEMRRLYQQQLGSKPELPQHEHYENWQIISNRMSQNARELCEQLRLILEPTKCTRLKGDYRTGRRINMKKIIPYIASQFRKDKIWLRRTKPAQRDYKITIAIDDSKSMHHNNSKTLTLEAISLVSQALTLLESGRLSVVSFGEAPKIILNHNEQFDGPKLVNALNFSQDNTKIAELLDFVRIVNTEEGASTSDNGLFENLLLVLSDGRNIFSEGKTKVKTAEKLARLQRIFVVYIIIDNPENKNSILDIQTMEMLPDSRINIKSYLDDFPFPYYVIVRDLNQLPLVLSEAMRQWFELVNSEQ